MRVSRMTQEERINILNILERLGAETDCGDCMFYNDCVSKAECIYDKIHDLIENDDSEPGVRCKDCVHGKDQTFKFSYFIPSNPLEHAGEPVRKRLMCRCDLTGIQHDDNWFCADGEREEVVI